MKRAFLCLLGALFILSGCGNSEKAEKELLSAEAIFAEIESEVGVTEYNVLNASYIENYYGIDMETLDEYYCIAPKNLSDVDTVLIFKVREGQSAETLKKAVEAVRTQKLDEMRDYMPQQYKVMEKSKVVVDGNYVYLVISEKAAEIESIIEKHIP